MANAPEHVTIDDDGRVHLHCPVALPTAGGFLWNPKLLVQVNCRGYVTAQHLQPEPAKYARAPVLEQTTFMQPEQPYFDHHPGRFVYIRDDDSGDIWSAPWAPARVEPEHYCFTVADDALSWSVSRDGIRVDLELRIPADDAIELWTITATNESPRVRRVSVYPYFTIGYMSWMNQSAGYDADLGGIVASSITPYQKLEEYQGIRQLKDRTFLLHGEPPDAWEASAAAFEGHGGLIRPAGIERPLLANGAAHYEMPAAVLQYRRTLQTGASHSVRLLFGPARDRADIAAARSAWLAPGAFQRAADDYRAFLRRGSPCLDVETPDTHFDRFVNRWLPRQVWYHGSANRFTTDPQTSNYLQDGMGTVYVEPATARRVLIDTLSRQHPDGGLPEGIRLRDDSELKYINQVPHTDHAVWLPVFLQAYVDETGDLAVLDEPVESSPYGSVRDAVSAALRWLLRNRDARGLSLIDQGDWCDPMNMVGPEGRGVSGWLTIATAHACRLWAAILAAGDDKGASAFSASADELTSVAQAHLWDGDWFARGITDAGQHFGVADDDEGRIYLNPQSWAILSGVATPEQVGRIRHAVDTHLDTPYGLQMLAPAYTRMRDDIGRLTQKFPGTAENGSVYSHAAAFYIAALYEAGDADAAYAQLLRAIPGPDADDYARRGQLPVFVPNYYRGAWRQYPETAGRSSQLFNTGAASWLYRIIIERLFGLQGTVDGLAIRPALPSTWDRAAAMRRFRGATFAVSYERRADSTTVTVRCDDHDLPEPLVRDIVPGRSYRISVVLPPAADVAMPAIAAAHGT